MVVISSGSINLIVPNILTVPPPIFTFSPSICLSLASIIGWGSNAADPIEKPSNAYYVLTVKKGSSISIKVESFQKNW